MKIIKNHSFNIFLILILIIGSFLRIYNINYEDLWIDEISTFWISNPNIDFETSYKNNSSLEVQPFFYNFLMKIYFSFLGYNVDYGRYVSAIFSTLSILSVSYISWTISKNKSYLLTAFLVSFNIFLISYAQELRVYSILFFFISLTIIFILQSLKKENFFNIFFLNFTFIFSIFLHPFSLILLFSTMLYLLLIFLVKRMLYKKIIYSIIGISVIAIIYNLVHLINLVPDSSEAYFFLDNPNLKFITNMYFSKFFGSRILGLCFLFLFLFALKFSIQKILALREVSFLFIFFLLSYVVPIIYGFLFHPIIQPKYIIFVIIPIIVIISDFIYLSKKNIKFFLIFLSIFITVGNLITEQTVRQFFIDRPHYKPEINKSLKLIQSTNNKKFIIKVDPYDDIKEPWTYAVENYLFYLIKKNKLKIEYLDNYKQIKNSIWVICIHDLNYHGCADDNFKIQKKIDLNRVTLSLILER